MLELSHRSAACYAVEDLSLEESATKFRACRVSLITSAGLGYYCLNYCIIMLLAFLGTGGEPLKK